MSNRGLAAGVFRAWGVMWSIYVLLGLPQFVNILVRDPYKWDQKGVEQFALSSHAISLGCEIVIAVFLIRKAAWLAAIVFPVEQEAGVSVSATDLQAILFSAVALYFLLDGVRHVLGSGYQLLRRLRGDDQNAIAYLWEREPENLVSGLGGALAGAYVLLGRGHSLSPWKMGKAVYQRLLSLRGSPNE